jgi:hypothetical protein
LRGQRRFCASRQPLFGLFRASPCRPPADLPRFFFTSASNGESAPGPNGAPEITFFASVRRALIAEFRRADAVRRRQLCALGRLVDELAQRFRYGRS